MFLSIFEKDVEDFEHWIVGTRGLEIHISSAGFIETSKSLNERLKKSELRKAAFGGYISNLTKPIEQEGVVLSAKAAQELSDNFNVATGLLKDADKESNMIKADIKGNQAEEAEYLEENFHGFIEVATALANQDLEPRIGHMVVVHSKENPVEGFTQVSLVNPAIREQDVATS